MSTDIAAYEYRQQERHEAEAQAALVAQAEAEQAQAQAAGAGAAFGQNGALAGNAGGTCCLFALSSLHSDTDPNGSASNSAQQTRLD